MCLLQIKTFSPVVKASYFFYGVLTSSPRCRLRKSEARAQVAQERKDQKKCSGAGCVIS